jgi:hypothetical protein
MPCRLIATYLRGNKVNKCLLIDAVSEVHAVLRCVVTRRDFVELRVVNLLRIGRFHSCCRRSFTRWM